MPTCLHCSARIPGGRTYCHPHYQEAIRQHAHWHQEAMAHWGRLSTGARAVADSQAEEDELCLMASLVATLMGGYCWYQVNALFPIDGLWGLMIMLATGFILLSWAPARGVIGKLARAAFVALPPLLYSLLGLGALCLVSETVRGHGLPLLFGMLALVMITSLIKEWAGAYWFN